MKINNKKIKIFILNSLFGGKKTKKQTVNARSFCHQVSKFHLVTIDEVEILLIEMQKDNLIDFVANKDEKDYNYTIRLKPKGEYFLSAEQSKGSDFIVGIFVYLIFFGLILLLVFVIKNIFGGGIGT